MPSRVSWNAGGALTSWVCEILSVVRNYLPFPKSIFTSLEQDYVLAMILQVLISLDCRKIGQGQAKSWICKLWKMRKLSSFRDS